MGSDNPVFLVGLGLVLLYRPLGLPDRGQRGLRASDRHTVRQEEEVCRRGLRPLSLRFGSEM